MTDDLHNSSSLSLPYWRERSNSTIRSSVNINARDWLTSLDWTWWISHTGTDKVELAGTHGWYTETEKAKSAFNASVWRFETSCYLIMKLNIDRRQKTCFSCLAPAQQTHSTRLTQLIRIQREQKQSPEILAPTPNIPVENSNTAHLSSLKEGLFESPKKYSYMHLYIESKRVTVVVAVR